MNYITYLSVAPRLRPEVDFGVTIFQFYFLKINGYLKAQQLMLEISM